MTSRTLITTSGALALLRENRTSLLVEMSDSTREVPQDFRLFFRQVWRRIFAFYSSGV